MKRFDGRLDHRMAAGDRAGEGDIVDAVGADQLGGVVMGQHQMLEQALGQAGGLEGLARSARRRAASGPNASAARHCPPSAPAPPR